MSIHIGAKPGEIAPLVLMPGDPLRAKYFSEKMLNNVRLVSSIRNVYFFTGEYKNIPLSIGASGMGIPSMGIYSYELFTEYGVECIIRIGTCGAYNTSLKLFDLINVDHAFSESTYAQCAFGFSENNFQYQGKAHSMIQETAAGLGIPLVNGNIHTGDAFYTTGTGLPPIAMENNCMAAEMEAFALFANARFCNKSAAAILTVSDIIPERKRISPEEREKSLDKMAMLAFETAARLQRD